MKVLVFSHGSDIDGMGSIIISKVYFDEIKYHYCEMSDIDEKILNSIKSKEIYNYNYIFVTDLCPTNETLDIIKQDSKLREKFIVIDHHKTRLNKVGDYDFVHINIEDNQGMCCATSLFYGYLLQHNFIKNKDSVKLYSELTRLEDTWEWKKNNNILAHNLSHLFNVLGRDEYILLMSNKLKNNKTFSLTKEENWIIDNKLKEIEKNLKEYANSIKTIEINDKCGALIIIDYQYRNEFPEYLKNNNYNYDFVMMVCFNHNSISFRSITDCNVREIAELYGGGGHDKAASCPLDIKKQEKIYDIILENKIIKSKRK